VRAKDNFIQSICNGNLANLWSSTSGGVTNDYQYDALNRLTNVVGPAASLAKYAYDWAGNLQAMRYANGVTNLCQYDSLNRLTNSVWKLNAGTLASFYYQLGLTGNRTNVIEFVKDSWRTNQWQYDPLYRLTNEIIGAPASGTAGCAYDPVGNRTNRIITGSLGLTNQSFTFNPNDWLTTDQYDNNGNTTSASGNSYQYDALNHVTNVNNTIFITYDGDGNRVSKRIGGTTNYYLLDDRNPSGYVQVLEEWTASSGVTNLSRVYNYGLSLISQQQGGTTYYFICDGHGSTRALYDGGGTFVNAFAYDAYGNLIASNGVPQTAYCYCGQQWDTDLGSYYLRARTYNPGTGRFPTMDSYAGNNADPLSLHKYLYCQANPVNRIDPSGLADYSLVMTYAGNTSWEFRFGLADPETYAAAAFNTWYGIGSLVGNDILVPIIQPNDDVFQRVSTAVNKKNLKAGTDRITKITIVGHGAEDGGLIGTLLGGPSDITLEGLQNSGSSPYKMLDYLQPFTSGSCEVYLNACFEAKAGRGQGMMKLMATHLGAQVIGYDDWFAVHGWGNQWTAYPNGTIKMTKSMEIERWNSFSVTNASLEGKLAYIKLNSQTPCPPRGAVPVTGGAGARRPSTGRAPPALGAVAGRRRAPVRPHSANLEKMGA
jgi:RHS repeat-associated protein